MWLKAGVALIGITFCGGRGFDACAGFFVKDNLSSDLSAVASAKVEALAKEEGLRIKDDFLLISGPLSLIPDPNIFSNSKSCLSSITSNNANHSPRSRELSMADCLTSAFIFSILSK